MTFASPLLQLSQGGTGGRFGDDRSKASMAQREEGLRIREWQQQNRVTYATTYSIRQQKLDAYIENDLEATDGTFGKIMSGTVRPCLLESGPPAPAS